MLIGSEEDQYSPYESALLIKTNDIEKLNNKTREIVEKMMDNINETL